MQTSLFFQTWSVSFIQFLLQAFKKYINKGKTVVCQIQTTSRDRISIFDYIIITPTERLKMKNWILVILLITSITACKKEDHQGIYKHGRLEYKITYLNAEDGNFDPSLLPRKMVLEFNSDFCTNTIDGFMGMFRLSNLTQFNKRKSTTYLKVLDKNYLFNGNKNELMCCFHVFEGLEIEHDTLTKNIAGLNSKHASITLPNTGETFEIYYTYDIDLDQPNITNPYSDIDGVLTDFVLFMGPYKMRFEAQKFNSEKIPSDDLRIPETTVELSRENMVYVLERVMN